MSPVIMVLPLLAATVALTASFDLSGSLVPKEDIRSGGPPPDGIPAILSPKFETAQEASWLKEPDEILGLVWQGKARAYPIRIMNWHEIVNDSIAGRMVVVTYCPLCGTGMAFDARAGGVRRTFGVSGLLYNSDVLMYDHQTRSLWSQLKMQAVTGPAAGVKLSWLPLEHTSWKSWRTRHPATAVLSRETGHRRDYARDPYAGYADRNKLYFPVRNTSARMGPKALVFGVLVDGQPRAYPLAELAKASGTIRDLIGERTVSVHFDPAGHSVRVRDDEQRPVPGVRAYWFAWYAFYPRTTVWTF